MFASLAVLVTVSNVNSFKYCVGTLISTGAVLTSRTTTRKLLVVDSGGTPSSLATTVIELVLGLWV